MSNQEHNADCGARLPRCICSKPGASIQCAACYPDLGRPIGGGYA